jgi:hypothetical protein
LEIKPGSVFCGNYTAPTNIPAGKIVDEAGSFRATTETRMLTMSGHRHAWTTRVNAWVVRADGTTEEVYDSFDWRAPPTYGYDSTTQNPTADPENQVDGALLAS